MAKILIVEDDTAIAAIERDYLTIDGFEVEIAENGQLGFTKGCTGSYDLILLDLMLPGMDGFEVCRRLREKIEKDPANPHYIETVWGAGYRFRGQ
ncbi:response regulator [[Clostridium] leptum]|nr:response regulator [[Clostridium] leptum]